MIERSHPDERRRVADDQTRVAQTDEREQQTDAGRRRFSERHGDRQRDRSRNRVAETRRNSTPAQNTMPSPVCQGTLFCSTIVKAKNAFSPIPGATANGSRA